MKSSPEEPKGFFDGFTLWDWFTIWVVSDVGSAGVMALIAGTGGIWSVVAASCLWWLHIYNVRNEIADGRR
jgi:hypothetical protein